MCALQSAPRELARCTVVLGGQINVCSAKPAAPDQLLRAQIGKSAADPVLASGLHDASNAAPTQNEAKTHGELG